VRAGQFTQQHRLELVDIPDATLAAPWPASAPVAASGVGRIVFRTELACLCGSDLPYFNAEAPEFPAAQIGHSLHEMVGTVLDTDGARFRPGDRVLAVPVNQQGLAERWVLDERRAIPLDPRLDDDHAVLAQPLGTAIYALKKIPYLLDKDVAVVGQGPMGQMFNALLRNAGAREIIGIDLLDSRLRLSSTMGATRTVRAGDGRTVEAVREMLNGELPDLVIEAVGHADQQLNLCIELCQHKGTLLYFGVPPTTIDGIRWRDLLRKNVTLHTSVNPDFARDFPLAMRMLAEGRLDLRPLVTHRFPWTELQTAFEFFRDRRDGAQKILIDFPRGT
jgi:threonine dehydrogenase-like Zn-dependent dehydrogenase